LAQVVRERAALLVRTRSTAVKQDFLEIGLGLFLKKVFVTMRVQQIVPQPTTLDFLLQHSLDCFDEHSRICLVNFVSSRC
jgi:hypothetical protein